MKPDQLFWEGKRFDSLSKDPAIDGLTPMVHVFPESQQQIESILELANNYDTKVWLNSSDKNRGYLNTIESKKSIVLHLIQMKPFQSTPLDDTPNLCLDLYVGF